MGNKIINISYAAGAVGQCEGNPQTHADTLDSSCTAILHCIIQRRVN